MIEMASGKNRRIIRGGGSSRVAWMRTGSDSEESSPNYPLSAPGVRLAAFCICIQLGNLTQFRGAVFLFVFFTVPLVWSPGPVNILLAGLGANHGVWKNMPFVCGLIARQH